MSKTAKTRLATVLTIVLIAALSVAGILTRGSATGSPTDQATTAMTSAPATPAFAPDPAAASVVVSTDEDDDEGDDAYEEEGDDD